MKGAHMKYKPELSGTALKYIAILAMTIDHTALAFADSSTKLYFLMRFIGRLTAPMMSFFLVEGFCHTRNFKKYLFRMILFGIAAQPFYFLLATGRPPENIIEFLMRLNVLFTLSISLIMLKIVSHTEWHYTTRLIFILPCFMLSDLCDWSYIIPAWVLVFFFFRKEKTKRNLLFALVSVGLVTYRFLPYYDSFTDFSAFL